MLSTDLRPPATLRPVERLMTSMEAARRLGITRQGVYHLVKMGKLEAIPVGGDERPHALLYRRADVERLAAERAVEDEGDRGVEGSRDD